MSECGLTRAEPLERREHRREAPLHGDAARANAVATLYALHAPRLRRVLRTKLLPLQSGLASRGEALIVDDLIQEVFARLLASQIQLAEGRDPVAYLVVIARNLVVDRIRRNRREARTTIADLGSEVTASVLAPSMPDDAEMVCQLYLRLEAIAAYVRNLPLELSNTYEARFVRGLSERDSAALLGISRRQLRTLEGCLLAGARQRFEHCEKRADQI